MSVDNALGDYLRARREALRPEDVGLPADGRHRRVAGLRREEVALLAGISPEYYLRLEQGRERHPSERVLSAIARGLRLGPPAEEFLQRLVRPLPQRGYDATRVPSASERLSGFILGLTIPAFAHDRVLEVIVSNPFARALSPAFAAGTNLMQAALSDPALRGLYRDGEATIARLVSYLRVQAATPPLDPRLPELVARLSREHPEFAALWAGSDVGAPSSGVNRLYHPLVGDLEVDYERLCFAGTDYPVIVMYHAVPGSPSAAALDAIGSAAGVAP